MPLLTLDTTDHISSPVCTVADGTPLSDYTQHRNNLLAIDNWFSQDHSTTTGFHKTTYGLADFKQAGSTSGTTTAPASVDGYTYERYEISDTIAYTRLNAISTIIGNSGSGIVEVIPGCSPRYPGPYPINTTLLAMRRLTSGSTNTFTFAMRYFRDDDNSHTYTYCQGYGRKYRVETQDMTRKSMGVLWNHYRQLLRLATNIGNGMAIEHDANKISLPPSSGRMKGRQAIIIDARYGLQSDTTISAQYKIGRHGNTFQSIFFSPGSSTWADFGTGYNCFLPAADDTYIYGDVQNPSINTNYTSQPTTIYSFTDDATTPALPALDTTSYATVSHAIRQKELQPLLNGFNRYWLLYGVEHEPASGCHAFPVSRLKGAVKVFDSTQTASSSVGNLGTPSTNITMTNLEAHPGIGWYYIPFIYGSPGSGIATISMAFDDTRAYSVLRRRTTGTSNTFNVRIWRVQA